MLKSQILNKEQIIAANDITTEVVSAKEWGGDVIIKVMTGSERDAFEASVFEQKGKDLQRNLNNLRAKLVARCLVGEDGNRLFNDKEIDLVGRKSAKVLDKLYEVAVKLNGIGAKEIEELTKNSGSEENAGSASSSPENSVKQ